ncbi:phosphotransferase [Ramlibacter alkalitolerans]|nr:phosphotransferase [Ramlibacter alkalitolerans]
MPHVDLSHDPAAMRRIFLALGLAAPEEEVRAQPLAGGVSSGIYRVDLRSGSYCVKQALPKLKVAKDWKVPVERVFAEIGYLRTVGAMVPGHVPQVLGEDAASKSFVMAFLGPEYRNWKAELLAGRIDVETARATGAILGRIHAATADDARLAAQFANDADFHALRLEPYLVETAREHPELAGRLLQVVERTAITRRVLVHGDVSPKNILLGPKGPVLLDAECAWFGDPAFDLAFCLNHFLLKAAHLPACTGALMDSFAGFLQAYWPQVRWEPVAALEQRVATLLPGLTLARVDGKSPVEYLAEPQRQAVRRAAIALLQQEPASLASIAGSWAREFA